MIQELLDFARGQSSLQFSRRRAMAVLEDIDAHNGVRVTLLEGGQQLESKHQGNRLTIAIPDGLSTSLPVRQAYVLKLAGAR